MPGLNPSDCPPRQDDPNNPDARRYVNLFVAQKDKVDDETYKKGRRNLPHPARAGCREGRLQEHCG